MLLDDGLIGGRLKPVDRRLAQAGVGHEPEGDARLPNVTQRHAGVEGGGFSRRPSPALGCVGRFSGLMPLSLMTWVQAGTTPK